MSLVEDMIEALEQCREMYRQACLLTVNEHLGTSLIRCLGCNRVLYPRGQWRQIPVSFRRQMVQWIIDGYAHDRCVNCYRAAVRKGIVDAVPRKDILKPEELEYLRRVAKGPTA